MSATRRFLATLLGCAALCAAASAQAQGDGAQRVLQQLLRGDSARQAITDIQGQVPAASADAGRSADMRQLQQAQQQLAEALSAYAAKGGSQAAVVARYESWRAAALIIQTKFAAAGERLRQSSDGSAYVGRHQQAQAQVQRAFADVRALLDPVLAPGAKTTDSAARAAAGKAADLLRQQRAAAAPLVLRTQPVPFGGLGLAPRQPVLSPVVVPSYERPAETLPAPEDRAGTAQAPLSDEIVAKAQALNNDFVRIYEYVRNNTRNEWYAGAVKGAVGVLRSGAGNDVDQASLLTALLRAAGLNTRYVQGAVELPLERLAAELGVPVAEAAAVPSALTKAGLAYNPVVQGGRVVAVQLARTWVSAYVPYTNYRGALVDASGKSWIPLDPFYKSVTVRPSTGVFGRSFNAPALATEYQQRTSSTAFADFLRGKTDNALRAAGLPGTWQEQRRSSSTDALTLDILPNSLPYGAAVVTREAADLPAAELGSVRIRLYGGGRTSDPVVLDKTLSLADAVNNRLTLSYGPASLEDHRLALLYGGMDAVPLYLISLRGQLKLGGDIAAEALQPVQPGATLRLAIDLIGPWGVQTVEQDVMAGAYNALVIANDPQRPAQAAGSDGERLGARLLDGLGLYYARQWNAADDDIAGWLDAGVVRPVPAVTLVSTTLRPTLVAGVPVTLQWTGVSIDAALRPVDAVGAKADDFLSLSALAGSSLEQVAFKDQFAVQAISADRGLQLANEQGLPLLDLTDANASALDATDHSDAVKAAVADLLRQGHSVRMPSRALTDNAWTGSVWQAFRSGHAGYFIAGGLAGGETVVPPEAWTLGFLADAFAAMQTEEANNDPRSGVSVVKIGAGDGQRGTVGEALPVPLVLLVRDKLGRPVKGAQVTFNVIGGDAKVGDGLSLTVATNALGMATATAKLGTSTAKNAVWILRNPGDESPTQVGLMSIDASVDSAAGLLQPPEPFSALALPGPLADLPRLLPGVSTGWPSDTAEVLGLGTVDQYKNPLPNINVNFAINSPAACPPGGPGGTFRPGALWNAFVTANACPGGTMLGQCGSPTLTMKSFSNGAVFAGVILSNELGGTNTVTASAGSVSKSFTYTNRGSCSPTTTSVDYYGYMTIRGGEADEAGNNIAAAPPGSVYPDPFRINFYRSEYPYFIDQNGTAQFLPFLNWVTASGNATSANVSGGGSATLSGSTFKIRTGLFPARNDATVSADVTVTGVRNRNGRAEPFSSTLGITGSGGTVFGVKANITSVASQNVPAGVNPNSIMLDARGYSLYPVLINYKIEPPDYKSTIGGWIASVLKDSALVDYASGNQPSGEGSALLPRAMQFEPQGHLYQARMSTRHSVTVIEGELYNLPMRQKLIADMRAAGASRFVDEVNKRVCDRQGTVAFILTQDGKMKITYQPLDEQGNLLGSPVDLVSERVYPAGINEELIDASKLGTGKFKITVSGTAVADPSISDEAAAGVGVIFQLQNSLPVGQVLVQGVNVRNGILTYQTPLLSIPGRGLPYGFGASYSSAGAGRLSTVGANWTHNLDLGLQINSCGEVSVAAGDSGSVRFFPGSDGVMVPDKGYHGTLVADRANNAWDFYSKDGTQYHYVFQNQRVQWKVAYIKDRNGNTQTFEYDLNAFPNPLLSRVTRTDGRNLEFKYEQRAVQQPFGAAQGPVSLITQVLGAGGTSAALAYDASGNLTSYTLNGRGNTFTYSGDAPIVADRYRMLTATNAKNEATTYTYLQQPLTFTGRDVQAGQDIVVLLDHLTVSQLTTPLGGTYSFSIDPGAWLNSTVTAPPGASSAYTFNRYGNPLSIVDPTGTTTMTWAEDDVVMRSKTDARGTTTSYGYDDAGNVTSMSVGGATANYTYERQSGPPYRKSIMTSRTDLNGNRISFGLDGNGNVVSETMPIGTLQHAYAGNGDRIATTDANGHTTRFEYDGYGNVSATVNAVGARMESARDSRGRVVQSTDGNGNRTTNSYDTQDNLIGQTTPAGPRSSTYDALGNKTSETDEGGRTTTWQIGPGSVVTSLKLAGPGGSAERLFTYDTAGNKLSETDWNGNLTSYSYDTVSRLTGRTEPLGKITAYTYDGNGNLLTETIDGRTTTHRYNALGHRIGTTDPLAGVWTYGVDNNGNRTSTVDPLGRSTSMVYDGMNRLTAINQPLGRNTAYTYDAAGNKTSETDPNGNTTQYSYDAANRMTLVRRANGTTVSSVYDLANNLTRQTDEGGGITVHTYDSMNRRLSTRDPEGGVSGYSYDALGNLVGETWPNGNSFSHAYDLFNRRATSSDSIGRVGTRGYDNNGNLTSEVDGNGNTSTHTYNALNFRSASSLPGGRSLGYTTDRFGNVLTATDARGNTTTNIYDKLNRLTRSVYADGGVVDSTYDAAGNKRTQTDALGHVTSYDVDDLNRVTTVTDPLGGKLISTYDAVGNLRTQTDKRGTVTSHDYDVLNRRVASTKAGVALETLTYTPLGKTATSTDANGNSTSYSYDRRGLLTATNAPQGATTLYARNAMGDVLRQTDPEGRVTTTSYDVRRRPSTVSNGAGETTRLAYDLANNKIGTTRPSGASTVFGYDANNWLVTVAEPAGRSSSYARDKNGNLTTFTDASGRATGYGYDALNRRTSVTYAGGASESYTPDKAGNLTRHVDANGIAVTRVFDDLNRETGKTYSASADGLSGISTGYDANGNVITVTETYAAGTRTSNFTYDAFDRQLTARDGFGGQIAYTYDPNGNRTTLATQDAKVTRYGYDSLNRLTGVASPAGSVQYVYDRSGLTTQQVWSNGTSTSTSHDLAMRPKRIQLGRGATALNVTEYSYDSNGNRSEERINRPAGAQITTYVYDTADRLTSTRRTEGATTVATTWTYDLADNRLSETVATTGQPTVTRGYTYDTRSRLSTIADSATGPTTLSYDAQGNLTQKVQGADTTAYVWNARDHLISVSRNGTVLGRYSTDHAGLRVSKEALNPLQPQAPPRVLRTQFDEDNAVQDRDSAGTVVARYDFAGRRPVALWSAEDGNQLLHADALGSIVATTAADGSVKSETLYDAWGNPIVQTGASANKFAYTGHQVDAETGLYYFKARYYDASIGRFISQDPAEGQDDRPPSYQKYLYAYANPTVYLDPTGMYSWSEFGSDAWSFTKGVAKGAGNFAYEALATTYDLEQVAVAATKTLVTGKLHEVEYTSAIGKAAEQGASTSDILIGGAKQAVLTPVRLGEAIAQGNAEAAGEESFNLALLLAPGAKAGVGAVRNVAAGLRAEGMGAVRSAVTSGVAAAGEQIVESAATMRARVGAAAETAKSVVSDIRSKLTGESSAGPMAEGRLAETTKSVPAAPSEPAPAAPPNVPSYETPYKPLSQDARVELRGKVQDRTITREEYGQLDWDRRFGNRRQRGVDRFWAEERRVLKEGGEGTRNWNPAQRSDILARRTPKFDGKPIQGHHRYNALDYPQLADRPSNIYPATEAEHLYRWHGGNFRNDTMGRPNNPLFPEEF